MKMKLLCLLGKESQISQLLDLYTEKLNEGDVAVEFIPLVHGIQDMTDHAFDKAIPKFEQVANTSSYVIYKLIEE